LVFDFVNNKYVRLIANNIAYDLANLTPYIGENSESPHIMLIIKTSTNANSVNTTDIANVIVTQNEP